MSILQPKKIGFLVDSCADLQASEENGIFYVSLRILCEDGEFLDGVNIGAKDIYARMRGGELPKTSLPSPEDVRNTFEHIAELGYDGVIAVMLSSGLSGTYNITRLIGEEFQDRLAVRVYDSLSASLGVGLTIYQLKNDIENGMEWVELTERRVPQLLAGVHPFLSVDTLEYLRKGGRIGRITAVSGTLLQIKPILSFAPDGQLTSIEKVRGHHNVIDKLVELTVKACGDHKSYNLAIANGGAPEEMEILRQKISAALPDYVHLYDGEFDGTLSVYIGDGALGVCVQVLD